MKKAFFVTFPAAVRFKGNIENKLCKLGFSSTVNNDIICDIMGRASELDYGLVDAKDQDELEVP